MGLNLGGITFGLSSDTSGLSSATTNIQNFGNRVSGVVKAAKGDIDSTTASLIKQEGAAIRALQSIQNMSAQISRAKIEPEVKLQGIQEAQAAATRFIKTMNTRADRPLSTLDFQRATLGFKEATDQINRMVASSAEAVAAQNRIEVAAQKAADAEARAAQVAANAVEANYNKQSMAVAKATNQVDLLIDAIKRQEAAGNITPQQSAGLQGRAQSGLNQFSGQLNATQVLKPEEFQSAGNALSNTLTKIQRDMKETASSAVPMTGAIQGFVNVLGIVNGPFNTFSYSLNQANELIREHGLALGVTTAAMAGFAAAGIGLVTTITRTVIAYQQVNQIMVAVTGNTAVAAAQFQFLTNTSNQAGLSVQALSPAFGRFEASAIGAGESVTTANAQFQKIAMTFGTMHLSSQDASNAIRTFDEMMSRGYVTTQDLVRRLANDFPGAMAIAEKATGKTGAALDELLRKGQVSGPAFVEAFTNAMVQVEKIDMSKPVDTLQASINRMGNAWITFILGINNALEASTTFKNVLDTVTNGLNFLAANANQVVVIVGTIAGAFTGAAAAMAAMAIIGTIGTLVRGAAAAFTIFRTAVSLVTSAEEVLTAVQIGLDAAMDANPVGALITALGILAGVVGGATVAWGYFNKAVTANNVALADTSGWDAYIAGCVAAGKQTASTTAEIEKQIIAQQSLNQTQLIQAVAAQGDTARKLQAAQQNDQQVNADPLTQIKDPIFHMSGRDRSHNALVQAKQQADQAAASVQQLSEAAEKYGNTLDALNSKVKPLGENTTLPKPDLKPQPQKNPNAGLGGIDQLIEKAKEAKASLDAMFAGPQDEGLVDAISKAKTAVDAIKGVPTEMAQAAKNLGVGDNVTAITDKLIELNAKVNITKEAVQDFTKVWNDINKVKAELSGTNAELAYMAAGGTKAGLAMSEGFKQAQEELAKLSPTSLADYAKSLQGTKLPQSTQQNMVAWAGTAQQAQLQAIIQKLRDAGVEVKSTGNAFNDASAGLTQFYGSADKAKNALQAMLTASENLRKSLETLKVAQSDANMNKLGAFGGGNLYDIRQNDQRQAATQQVTQMQDAGVPNANFTSMSAQIAASGIAFTQGATAAETLTNALVAMDNATVLAQTQAATWKTILTQQQTAWTTFGTNSVDVLSKILQGTMSLKQGVKTVLADLMQTIANAALFDPLKANLTSAIQGLMSGGQGLNGFSFGNLFQGVLGLGQNSITGAAGAGIGGATKAIAGAGKDAVQLANTTAVTASTVAITANTAAMAALTSVVGVSLGTSTISDATSDVSALSAALTFAATGGYIQRFAGGGSPMVRGIGGPTGDKIPAWLSDGEFVVNAQGTKDNLSTLMAINNGGKATTNSKGWLRFASGGAVSTNGGSTVTPLYTPSVDQINRGTGSNSSVTSQTSHTTIDASTTLVVQGSIDSVTHDTLTATLNDRDQKMKAQLPALIDGRVSDSIRRNRY